MNLHALIDSYLITQEEMETICEECAQLMKEKNLPYILVPKKEFDRIRETLEKTTTDT